LNRELPEGGLRELQHSVREEEKFFARPPDFFVGMVLTNSVVNRFLSFIFAAAYTDAVQGRIQGLNDVPLGAAHLLISATPVQHMTDQFKTADIYGFQAVVIPTWLKPYVAMWIKDVRPSILMMLSRDQAAALILPMAPLWIRFNGSKVTGHSLVSGFFREKLNINVTR
jgi:hypothetical protein